MKIAVLFNQFGPYHYARLNALGKVAEAYGIEFFSKSETYDWNAEGLDANISFHKRTLFTVNNPSTISKKELAEKIYEILNDINPDVVAINGWSETGAFAALKWCLLNQKSAVAMSESTEFDVQRSGIKELIKKKIVSNFSAALVGGTPHKRYMHKLGMPQALIFEKYDVVDNSYFQSKASQIRSIAITYKADLNLPDNFFLASARFVPKKNLERLIKAYSLYLSQNTSNWSLVLLGDGELRSELENLVKKLGLTEKVLMPGFKQYSELPYYYTLANAFIHASTSEQWGLVVNEAMACGLPVLISNRVGCAEDLVRPEVNGLVFDAFSETDMAEKMALITSGKFDLSNLSKKSLEIISDFTPDNFASNLVLAAERALKNKKKGLTLLNRVLLNYFIQK